jgi:hypothetical protein
MRLLDPFLQTHVTFDTLKGLLMVFKNILLKIFASVFYDRSNNQTFWSSNTAGNPDASLVLQNDGNLIVQTKLTKITVWSSENPTSC